MIDHLIPQSSFVVDHMLCGESPIHANVKYYILRETERKVWSRWTTGVDEVLKKRVTKPGRQFSPTQAQAIALTSGPFTCFSFEQPVLWLVTDISTFLSLPIFLRQPRYSACKQGTLRIHSTVSILFVHYLCHSLFHLLLCLFLCTLLYARVPRICPWLVQLSVSPKMPVHMNSQPVIVRIFSRQFARSDSITSNFLFFERSPSILLIKIR